MAYRSPHSLLFFLGGFPDDRFVLRVVLVQHCLFRRKSRDGDLSVTDSFYPFESCVSVNMERFR